MDWYLNKDGPMNSPKDRSSERIEHLEPNAERQNFFDLSTGGVCCLSKRSYDTGASVKVRVGDSDLAARVAHCTTRTDGFRIGLQFVNLTPAQQSRLGQLVERYSRGIPLSCGIVEAPGA